MSEPCAHEHFAAMVEVYRQGKVEGGPITNYTADVHISCAACHEKFLFVGLPHGASPYAPMVSIDATELRAPIAPYHSFPPANLPGYRMDLPMTDADHLAQADTLLAEIRMAKSWLLSDPSDLVGIDRAAWDDW